MLKAQIEKIAAGMQAMAANIKSALIEQVDRLSRMPIDDLVDRRYKRLMSYGISN